MKTVNGKGLFANVETNGAISVKTMKTDLTVRHLRFARDPNLSE